tara:strand:- start:1 stop:690 length:690 start_codon:yes stop_codon:yes gene_type:complete
MLQQGDKKKSILFIFVIIFFLTSINSQQFIDKKKSFYDLKKIEVKGLDEEINLEIKKNLNFLKNTNIFFVDDKILKDQIGKYEFIENYNVFKSYPSKIIFELQRTEFLAVTIKDNETFIIGSNGKFINVEKFKNYENLPKVFGKFSAKDFINFRDIIYKSDLKYKNIKEIFFYPSGRIDIKNKDNILIKLPMKNLKKALVIANKVIQDENLNKNIIDLRIPNQLILSNE